MLTAPGDLDERALGALLGRVWGIGVTGMTYRPVGWGSHHWEVTGGDRRWFVTVDELEKKRVTGRESLDGGFARLRASLRSAVELARAERDFVVAPVMARGPVVAGEPVVRLGERFAVAVYPFVEGRSFDWGELDDPGQRLAVLAMVTAVHTAPGHVLRHAFAEDFSVPFRDELEAACGGEVAGSGPYAEPVAALARECAGPIRRLLERYDELVSTARSLSGREVLTHGEPHPGNTMLAEDWGWLLIDWDTALIAPPERDLWGLDPGDGSVIDAYAAATGVTPVPELLELYRLGWDIKDIAVDVSRFRRPHAGTAEDDKSWELMSRLIRHVSG